MAASLFLVPDRRRSLGMLHRMLSHARTGFRRTRPAGTGKGRILRSFGLAPRAARHFMLRSNETVGETYGTSWRNRSGIRRDDTSVSRRPIPPMRRDRKLSHHRGIKAAAYPGGLAAVVSPWRFSEPVEQSYPMRLARERSGTTATELAKRRPIKVLLSTTQAGTSGAGTGSVRWDRPAFTRGESDTHRPGWAFLHRTSNDVVHNMISHDRAVLIRPGGFAPTERQTSRSALHVGRLDAPDPASNYPGHSVSGRDGFHQEPFPAATGAIHLDGNLLGQWVTRHLERSLLQPARGPTGVDPRVVPAWGPFSAAY